MSALQDDGQLPCSWPSSWRADHSLHPLHSAIFELHASGSPGTALLDPRRGFEAATFLAVLSRNLLILIVKLNIYSSSNKLRGLLVKSIGPLWWSSRLRFAVLSDAFWVNLRSQFRIKSALHTLHICNGFVVLSFSINEKKGSWFNWRCILAAHVLCPTQPLLYLSMSHVKPGHMWREVPEDRDSSSVPLDEGRKDSADAVGSQLWCIKNQCNFDAASVRNFDVLQPLRSSYLCHWSSSATWNRSRRSMPLEYYLVVFKGLGLGVKMVIIGTFDSLALTHHVN